ncbi:MAG: NADH:ubiquinone reductase (Na(+)-transporting) subunit C [Cryomorphaceae bacterium]|nr:MAG: NADH:ubiquinone reductase (Na(+)-transporting) subunit C [Cryomorphaceae bacterium]
MALDKNSNAFTFGFALVMVVVVGAVLSSLAMGLKPLQLKNQADKKRIDILTAIDVDANRTNAAELFDKYVVERVVIDYEGNVISSNTGEVDQLDDKDAFNINIRAEYRDRSIKPEGRNYPFYKCDKDGKNLYVIPMVGNGLWGAIWGFVALEDDFNTVYGASFDHATETPGLGAEISLPMFQDPFKGKQILDDQGNYKSIEVKKGGAEAGNPHQVDGITGGTITSDGVTEMLQRTLKVYHRFFNKNNA